MSKSGDGARSRGSLQKLAAGNGEWIHASHYTGALTARVGRRAQAQSTNASGRIIRSRRGRALARLQRSCRVVAQRAHLIKRPK